MHTHIPGKFPEPGWEVARVTRSLTLQAAPCKENVKCNLAEYTQREKKHAS